MGINTKSSKSGTAKSSKAQSSQYVKGQNFYRNAKQAKTAKMLSHGGTAIRDKDGKIIQNAPYQSSDATPGRVQADRRWFGNTRVISQTALDHFRESLSAKQNDPYSVILKQNKLPMSLLEESAKQSRPDLVTAEPFAHTFGPRMQRKKPRIGASSIEELVAANAKASTSQVTLEDSAEPAIPSIQDALVQDELEKEEAHYKAQEDADDEARDAPLDYILSAGTSRRIWGELYKVLDSSDVILHVLDARDPLGTRCESVEKYLAKEKRHKKVVYILNKVDLVPGWVAARWVRYLSQFHPTIAFHASINHSFGKGALIQLLRQFSNLFSDKKQICIGFVGYPNVGKSSIINTLKKKKVCNVAPLPGETKVWQYITLMKRIYLIDCPGIVPPSARDTETAKVLKGVVRVEHLSSPEDHIPPLLERVRAEYLKRTYALESWRDADDLLEQMARKSGRLGKGGEADTTSIAKMVLNDWIRGRLPFFERPPDMPNTNKANKEGSASDPTVQTKAIETKPQPLHQIVHSNKFVDEDEQVANVEEAQEWAGIGSEPVEAMESAQAEDDLEWEELFSDADPDAPSLDKRQITPGSEKGSETHEEDDDLEIIVESDAEAAAPVRSAKRARAEDEEDAQLSKAGRKRMTTNKKKAENFYSTANVKNRNRNKKLPSARGRK